MLLLLLLLLLAAAATIAAVVMGAAVVVAMIDNAVDEMMAHVFSNGGKAVLHRIRFEFLPLVYAGLTGTPSVC
jgi:hypothetical protein